MSTFHRIFGSFLVKNDFSHSEQESQKDKKRHWPSHFKRFIKKKLKNDPSYHLLKMTLLKSANDSLREIFIQWVHTNTVTHTPATNTQRFAITFW